MESRMSAAWHGFSVLDDTESYTAETLTIDGDEVRMEITYPIDGVGDAVPDVLLNSADPAVAAFLRRILDARRAIRTAASVYHQANPNASREAMRSQRQKAQRARTA